MKRRTVTVMRRAVLPPLLLAVARPAGGGRLTLPGIRS